MLYFAAVGMKRTSEIHPTHKYLYQMLMLSRLRAAISATTSARTRRRLNAKYERLRNFVPAFLIIYAAHQSYSLSQWERAFRRGLR